MGKAMAEGKRVLITARYWYCGFCSQIYRWLGGATSSYDRCWMDYNWLHGRLTQNVLDAYVRRIPPPSPPPSTSSAAPVKPGSESAVGDWRDVLHELPVRIHEWMPRLAQEGVVGADAIFACLGPALEIFSRYSRVEKASGEQVTLKVYLEHVWAAVAKEALAVIFQGADATGFEEDARLTAMWLWTLSTGANGNGNKDAKEENDDVEDEEASGKSSQHDRLTSWNTMLPARSRRGWEHILNCSLNLWR